MLKLLLIAALVVPLGTQDPEPRRACPYVRVAEVKVRCTADVDGVLQDCGIAEETHPQCDFGPEAVRTASEGRLSAAEQGAAPRVVYFTLRFGRDVPGGARSRR